MNGRLNTPSRLQQRPRQLSLATLSNEGLHSSSLTSPSSATSMSSLAMWSQNALNNGNNQDVFYPEVNQNSLDYHGE